MRILIVLKDLRIGNGVASCLMGYYDGLLERGYNVDFLLLYEKKSVWMDIARTNGNVFVLPVSKMKYTNSARRVIKKVFRENDYDIVHVNLPGPYGAWVLKEALHNGVKYRIYHSHNPRNTSSIKAKVSSTFYTKILTRRANIHLACSTLAGESVFGSGFSILKNCIDTEHFKYSQKQRETIRNSINISDDTLLLGSVGRLEEQKNPLFAVKCFIAIKKICPNSKFIWLGDGKLKPRVTNELKDQKIEGDFILAGVQENVNEWYSAFDCFMLPSKAEGLGIVFLEAQAAGLPCVGSTNVPPDVEITPLMSRLDLNEEVSYWADFITHLKAPQNREKYALDVKVAGYDIKSDRYALADFYKMETSHI